MELLLQTLHDVVELGGVLGENADLVIPSP